MVDKDDNKSITIKDLPILTPIICDVCTKIMGYIDGSIDNRVFCSKECQLKTHLDLTKKDNSDSGCACSVDDSYCNCYGA